MNDVPTAQRYEYTASLSASLVERYQDWTSLDGLCMRIVTHDDGTAEVWFSKGDRVTAN